MKLNLTCKIKLNQPKTIGTISKMFCIFWSKWGDPSLIGWWVIVWTSKKLTHRQTDTHTHTDTGDDNTPRTNGPRVKTWTGYWVIPSNNDMQRAVPGESTAGHSHSKTDLLTFFCSDVLYDFAPTHVDRFLLLHRGYSFVPRILSQLICHFDTAFYELYWF